MDNSILTKLIKTPQKIRPWPTVYDPTVAAPWAIFYNVFIPVNDTAGQKRSAAIFHEQMKQIGKSYANSFQKTSNRTTTVYYNTIGHRRIIDHNPTSDEYCRANFEGLRCHHIAHYDKAFEDVTLQNVYEYCQDFLDHTAIYMHNKGSYQPRNFQHRIRRSATKAVTSQLCLDSLIDTGIGMQQSNQCNACGDYFMPHWGPIFSANFFAAHCNYIQQLLSPLHIEDALAAAHVKFLDLEKKGHLKSNILGLSDPLIGAGRYSHEDWIAGHPSVHPCDVHCAKNHPNQSALAPCHAGDSEVWYGINQKIRRDVLANESLRMREYTFLPGHLFRWFELYGQAPANHSWVWDWYPDGLQWRNAVAIHGSEVIQNITAHYINRAF